ncbi:hypothetical protein CHUAL_007882, partial [Chamberlinius hualienensis]
MQTFWCGGGGGGGGDGGWWLVVVMMNGIKIQGERGNLIDAPRNLSLHTAAKA